MAGSKRRLRDSTASQPSEPASSTRERSPSPRRPAAKTPRLSSQEVPAAKRPASSRSQELKNRDQKKNKEGDVPEDIEMGNRGLWEAGRSGVRETGRRRERDQSQNEVTLSGDLCL